ncbi:hypothetical protein AB0G85_25105 [Streptomyces sioyaensis]|uniref:hypothetical protein n=1 Tax=Streptomyces sioyaensis TaxID=67364 RepID=UPI0033C25169
MTRPVPVADALPLAPAAVDRHRSSLCLADGPRSMRSLVDRFTHDIHHVLHRFREFEP